MQKITMDIALTLKGPILSQASNPGELGLDSVVARHEDHTPYLPGTLVTGKLRQALEELSDIVDQDNSEQISWFRPELKIWLGQHSEHSLPSAKQLYFSDFDIDKLSESKMKSNHIRDRITIEEETGAVKPRHIVMLENPFASGEDYTFIGRLHFFSTEESAKNTIKHIKVGFNWLNQLGSLKSVGFGQVQSVSFKNLRQLVIQPPTKIPTLTSSSIGLVIKPLYPFCLSRKSLADNLFESDAIIPGGVIKGSIATTWSHMLGRHTGRIGDDQERKELQQNFSQIRITHAFPGAIKDKRPVVAPLSLVKTDDKKCYDVARLSTPCLINNRPPDFSLDWKDDKETLKEYSWPYIRMKSWGWAALSSELRVRTAIDRESYRSQKSELFAYEQIVPKDICWYANLDLGLIEDESTRANVLSQLESLLTQGFIGLGKTKTPVDIKFVNPNTIASIFPSRTRPESVNQWIVTLQTDTLLGTPKGLDEASGENELEEMYQLAWKELSDNKLKLVRYFARQSQFGGSYLRAHFQGGQKIYRPWLLSEAGSVFVLQSSQNDEDSIAAAKVHIEKWLQHGVPLSQNVCDYYRIDCEKEFWTQCPYIPENGYGEISVNVDAGENVVVLEDNHTDTINPIQCNALVQEA